MVIMLYIKMRDTGQRPGDCIWQHVCPGLGSSEGFLVSHKDREWAEMKPQEDRGEYNTGSPIKRGLRKGESNRATVGQNCHFGKGKRTVDMVEVEMIATW